MSESIDVHGDVGVDQGRPRGDFGPVILYKGASFTFVSFGAFVGLGAILGLSMVWLYLGGYQILPTETHGNRLALMLATGAPLSAYIITRLLDMRTWLSGEKTFIQYISTVSFGLWGGLLGGIGIVISFSALSGTSLLPLLDAFAVGIPLSQIFGRIGCLNYGCCHGREVHSGSTPAIRYHDMQTKVLRYDPKLRSKRLHPTQIYSALANLFIFLLMITIWLTWEARPLGTLAGSYFLLYGIKRFAVEFLRGEFPRVYFYGLTVWQWFSLLFVFGGSILLVSTWGNAGVSIPFQAEMAVSSLAGSFWVLLAASLVLSLAYGLHGRRLGSWG